MSDVIAIDLGGTAIKLGRFNRDGECSQTLTVATPQSASPDTVIDTMAEAIAKLDPHRRCVAIGIGTPGPVDVTGRVSLIAINLDPNFTLETPAFP